MKESSGQTENSILFCTRPWRTLGAVVVGLMAITFVWGLIVLTTYQDDDRFGNDRTLSVTEFLSRNIALPGTINLPDAIAPVVVAIDGKTVNGDIVSSGVIVGANGYVLTTLHAIDGLTDITVRVRTVSGIQAFNAQIVKKAPGHDLVMLKIKSPGNFLYLSLADAPAGPAGGETVYAFGQGSRGNLVVRQGVLSRQSSPLAVEGLQISHLHLTDAVYSWEQNGGPVVNGSGALVGLTLATQDAGGAIRGYVIPANVISAHFRDVVTFKTATAPTPVPAPAAGALPARMLPAALPPPLAGNLGALPGIETNPGPWPGGPATGAASWWLRAANQVGGGRPPLGINAAPNGAIPNGPPLSAPMAGPMVSTAPPADLDHLLGVRIAGFPIEDLIGLTLLALAKGVIGGMMTMGGGVFLVAGMMVFFGYGLFLIRPVAYLTNIFVYSASSLRHHRNGMIQWDEVKTMAPWAMIGVILGYFIGNSISDRLIEILLAVFAVLIAIKAAHEVLSNEADEILLTRNGPNGHPAGADPDLIDEPAPARSGDASLTALTAPLAALTKPALLALPMGILSGILGITGGVVEVPLQHYLGKVPLKNAIANSAALVFCASLTGTILSFIHGTSTGLIDWQAPLALAAILIPASFAGGVAGAHLTKRAPKPVLKAVFSVLMLAVAVRMFIGH
ncbi:putative membrane transporter protein MamO [Azospirillaceae bacterium]|nr:putative membrane transporter protein MamO [uncultured bacterium]